MSIHPEITDFLDRRQPAPATAAQYTCLGDMIDQYAAQQGTTSLEVFSEDSALAFIRWLKQGSNGAAARCDATIRKLRSQFVTLWKFLYRRKLTTEFPMECRDFPRLRTVQRQPVAWTEADISRIVEAIPAWMATRYSWCENSVWNSTRWANFVRVAYYTGARPQALFRVKLSHLDGAVLTLRGESDKKLREHRCVLPGWLVDDLRAMVGDGTWLFPDTLATTTFYRLWKELLAAAGVGGERYYSGFKKLRKSHITHMAARAGVQAASASVDHASSAVTTRHYIDKTQLPGQSAAEVLPKL